ncbi:6-hydroxymethylpterin diphosphokinase MptE-like protein [Methanimicrococcus blatticola]|uniref:6-hydroxymethyl-7,8-dihydropterin pyrophosphokinase n=1 Tax=Methanimicrococcus blatticola TaxID=91560 RepID=A0A484F7M5_9EURY|nr:6-hydroxymethylpterin diphosphokinase MptE-like protein [Methanimicrococcus blatticola]MBZ3934852.1 DUF115 domain-containing protein [Methanimicrococcus blatticola]MCC2509050.1 DUF115 domain-containing protein [Methanimicrococcus blatticola]TDQ70926.1 hypothetical protein C7391_0019 [Methanimicrococcus blatticola]
MNFTEWESYYTEILNKFGFPKEKDEKTALWLSNEFKKVCSLENRNDKIFSILEEKISRRPVVVCGNAPSLEKEYIAFLKEKSRGNEIYIAADGAATVLLQNNRIPDIIVTDLDGKHPNDAIKEIEAVDKGALLLVHAHGDNLDKLEKYLPAFSDKINQNTIIPTCQCRPPDYLLNFGGFTDGDRCVFLADAFNAASVVLIGFDFKDPSVLPLKKKKLECAEKLIQLIREKEQNPEKIRFYSEL